jgi:hypothetical protein
MDTLEVWQRVEKTDPAFTKGFSRGGGFKGTATNATYLARKATEIFGPCGIGWGVTVLNEQFVEGAPLAEGVRAVIHKLHVRLWYVLDGKRGEVEHFGQTEFVYKNKNGLQTDEEAPKKSLTDAMSKCLSLLGFSADIFLGLYDDNKYVQGLREEFSPAITAEQAATIREWIDAAEADEAKFCAVYETESVDSLRATKYDSALAALKTKHANNQKQAKAA